MKIVLLGRCPDKVEHLNQIYSWMMKTTYQGLILNNHTVYTINYKNNNIDYIENKLYKIEPDIIFTHLTFHHWHDVNRMLSIFENIREYYNTKIIHTLQDARHEPRYNKDISFAFDMALVGQTQNIKKFSKYWNIPVYFWPYCSLTYNKMEKFNQKYSFNNMPVFPGSPNAHNNRAKFLKQLQAKIPIKIITTKSNEDIKNVTHIASVSISCILALCTGYDINHYTDCRYWQYGGAGAILLGRRFKGMDDLIPRDLYYGFDSYNQKSVNECIKLYQHIKKTDNSKMRKNIFEFIQTYHNSKIRMKQTIELIMNERKKLDVFINE